MILYNKLLLVESYIRFYEQKLIKEFGLDLEEIEGPVKGIAPIVYSSILNKKVSPRPRTIEIAKDFIVPEVHAHNWAKLREKIELGEDLSPFLSKDHIVWHKVDFLLACSNIYHIHLTTRRGGGTNKELIFGVFDDQKFYAITFGDHHSIYQIDDLYEKAESSWPGQLFRKAEAETDGGYFDKRMVNNPDHHMNLLKPAGKMSGHQRSHLITLFDGDAEIRNISFELWCAFDNEVEYLVKLEDKLATKHGYLADQNLKIDFGSRRYKVSAGSKCYLFNFSQSLTISGVVADFGKVRLP
ncbi:hypothetical protein [Pseudomonas vranovensis]|uniref:Uncharacterized protein n=1 Tax=Pseudomonas vranovensis TaxID=321661 RepID=A0A423D4X4_9PSED|nr:hypothetical protein [Pseudomonas vranovensis]ROL66616.1 hypothetical protein BHU25_20765 [Pseudomonas vranovensis]